MGIISAQKLFFFSKYLIMFWLFKAGHDSQRRGQGVGMLFLSPFYKRPRLSVWTKTLRLSKIVIASE